MAWRAKKINRPWGGGIDKYSLEKLKELMRKEKRMYGRVMSKRQRFLLFARALIGVHMDGKQLSSEFKLISSSDPRIREKERDVFKWIAKSAGEVKKGWE